MTVSELSVPVAVRQPGPDVVRAVAMAGVVMMNYHGYLILRGGRRDGGAIYDVFDPWTGPLSTRFAATFVLTAGVGVTLMTRSSMSDGARRAAMSWRLVRRGLLLYGVGMLFDFVWNGTILPYYGALFVLAAVLFRLPTVWVAVVGTVAAVAGWSINWWVFERDLDGHDTDWLTAPGPRSPFGLIADVFVNGTHPLLPWLAFFCAGIALGRLLGTAWWRPATVATGFALLSIATFAELAATGIRSTELLSTHPFDRGLAYTASALGTALLAFALITAAVDVFADTALVGALQSAGQLSLTVYVAHALVFNLLVDWLDLIEPGGIATSLGFAAIYWLAAITCAVAYQRRFGRGPVETVYRALTG
ncbi:MAG TPA: DUF418 domain-containing protein [Ilumatobacter sp.]|nr:DUF418 domain-containing protein [Ilumatobacter sp.]